MAHTTYTHTYRPTHIGTSDGVRLDSTAYTHTDLLIWQGWAQMVATHPIVIEEGMVEDAQARVDRLSRGEVWDTDISGLQDWADGEDWTTASAIVLAIASSHAGERDRDMDALWEIGEVDMETVFGGYLWHIVEQTIPEMDEDTNEALADAMVDYWCEMLGE